MKILSSEIIKGGIYARLCLDAAEINDAGDERRAVEKAIIEHAASVGASSLLFIRVTELVAEDDGSITLSFDAAIEPEVKLGQYKGLVVKVGHNEDFEDAALSAAIANMSVEVPEIIVERKLDNMMLETQSRIFDSVSINTLADIRAIIQNLGSDMGLVKSIDQLWNEAIEISEDYLSLGVQELEAFVAAIAKLCPADSDSITNAVFSRARQRSSMQPQALGEQLFEALLRSEGTTAERWREDNRALAELRCRGDFLINAVAAAEDPEISQEEFDAAAAEFAAQYQLSVEEFLEAMTPDAVLRQLKAVKARQLIVDSAKEL